MKVRTPQELVNVFREFEEQGKADQFKYQLNFDELSLLIMSLELMMKMEPNTKVDMDKFEDLKQHRKLLIEQN
jgi:hypothetical protein